MLPGRVCSPSTQPTGRCRESWRGVCTHLGWRRGRGELRLSQVDAGVAPGPADAPVDTCFCRVSSTLSLGLPCRPGGLVRGARTGEGGAHTPKSAAATGSGSREVSPAPCLPLTVRGWPPGRPGWGLAALWGRTHFPLNLVLSLCLSVLGREGTTSLVLLLGGFPRQPPGLSGDGLCRGPGRRPLPGPRPTCSAASVLRAAGAWGLLSGAPLCVLPGDLSQLPNIRMSITCE